MEQDKNVWILVLVAVAVLFLFGSFGMGGYGMMGFGFLFMILFLGVAVWLIISLTNATQKSKKNEDALTILKRRYASGEISKKQYEEMKKELGR